MTLLALDPGPTLTAWVKLEDGFPVAFGHEDNLRVQAIVSAHTGPLAIEMIACYGMPVGAEVFETCVWIGRFDPRGCALRIPRLTVKSHLCHSAKANDSTIRQALLDRFGPGKELAVGRKASPGPLYGVSGDVWAALAVAVTAWDRRAA